MTQEELELALSGRFVMRVVYLEDPNDALPIAETCRRAKRLSGPAGRESADRGRSLGPADGHFAFGWPSARCFDGPDDDFSVRLAPVAEISARADRRTPAVKPPARASSNGQAEPQAMATDTAAVGNASRAAQRVASQLHHSSNSPSLPMRTKFIQRQSASAAGQFFARRRPRRHPARVGALAGLLLCSCRSLKRRRRPSPRHRQSARSPS